MILRDKVNHIVAETVRPILRSHGGDIEVVAVEDKNVKVRLLGACSSCPSMQNTMEEIVESTLRQELGDKIDRIILWNIVSDELIDIARNILRK